MKTSDVVALAPFAFFALTLSAQAPVPTFGPADVYPNLQRALQLTPEQWRRIADEAQAFQSFLNDKADRLTQLDNELRTEQLRPSPDPLALGVRHVEAASICRESTVRLAVLRDNARQVMNADQKARLARLEAGRSMLPALAEGQNLLLIGTEQTDALPGPGESAAAPSRWRASRSYGELLPGCPVPAGFGVFIGGIVGGSFTAVDRFPNLTRRLELTERQVARIVEINQRRAQSMGERQFEVNRLREEMVAEAARDLPDPAVLGARAARLEQICREGQAADDAVRAEMPALLTESQRAKWQELERALQLLPALGEAQDANLAGRAPGEALPPVFLTTSARSLAWNVTVSPGQTFPGCETGTAAAWWYDTGAVVPQAQSAKPAMR